MNLLNIILTSLITENIVLYKFLGICPFIGTSNKEKNAIGMGISVTLVTTLSSLITYLIYNYILVPSNTTYLKTIMFILVIASLVQLLILILKKYFTKLHQALGIYLPLITTNCAVLGVTLLNINNNYNLIETLVFSISTSLGFTLVMYIFASIREYLNKKEVPKYMKGSPIALITASIMAILFQAFW